MRRLQWGMERQIQGWVNDEEEEAVNRHPNQRLKQVAKARGEMIRD
jgi:hypothetical protein